MSKTKWTEGPWEYVASTEHHGPFVRAPYRGDIADCYTMSDPGALSVRNGGTSRPIHFQHDEADANARLIAAAPDLAEALADTLRMLEAAYRTIGMHPEDNKRITKARAALARAKGAS